VVGLRSDAKEHLSSVDERAGLLVDGLGELRTAIDRIEHTAGCGHDGSV